MVQSLHQDGDNQTALGINFLDYLFSSLVQPTLTEPTRLLVSSFGNFKTVHIEASWVIEMLSSISADIKK